MSSNRIKSFVSRFLSRTDGNVAILFGLSSVALFSAVCGGVELSRGYNASQKLHQAANLACQYASRPSQVQLAKSAPATYSANVRQFITTSLANQKFPFTQTNATPFTYVQDGAADVNLASTVPTIFAGIVHISTMPITARAHCYDTPSKIPQLVPNSNSNVITQEGFENTAVCSSGFCYVSSTGNVGKNGQNNANGSNGTTATPSSTPSTTASYTGSGGAVWYVTGYCVEIDKVGTIRSTIPEGSFSAELDCDNGSGNAGNSSISTKVYLPSGSYELRYNYVSRVGYPNYDPVYICGSTAVDVGWANDTGSNGGPVANASRTNQINVYLDADTGGSAPTHATLVGSMRLAGSNLIDVCVQSKNWIERSVRINVTTAGFYWLSFAADGQNDSYGGQIDNIRLCNGTCQGSVQDNFPSTWQSSSMLFEDTFDAPGYANNSVYSTSGNMNVSYGTSGTSTSGWPSQPAQGWATGPYNQMAYVFTTGAPGSPQGGQSIMPDGGSSAPTNRLTSRPFLLDPGYYRIDYYYISNLIFSTSAPTYCASAPNAAAVASANRTGTGNAYVRFYPSTTGTVGNDTNIVGAFMSHAQLASTPIGGGALNSQTSYNNPDGTVSATPTVSPASVSLANYNASQVNPLIDICTYATSWQSRTVNVRILKPAYYWLTFAALGSGEGAGGGIDDVRLTALGSLNSTAPSSFATIPVPAPQPGTTYTNGGQFAGFSIIANPLTTPAS